MILGFNHFHLLTSMTGLVRVVSQLYEAKEPPDRYVSVRVPTNYVSEKINKFAVPTPDRPCYSLRENTFNA